MSEEEGQDVGAEGGTGRGLHPSSSYTLLEGGVRKVRGIRAAAISVPDAEDDPGASGSDAGAEPSDPVRELSHPATEGGDGVLGG